MLKGIIDPENKGAPYPSHCFGNKFRFYRIFGGLHFFA